MTNKSNNDTTPNAVKIYNVQSYLQEHVQTDIKDFASSRDIKSGYINIDMKTSMYPGLYVIGAISSLGKTTFIHQMCDQMAKAGEHVIYFSLEQNVLEMVSKSLARTTYEIDASAAMTSLQIRRGEKPEQVKEAAEAYGSYAGKITVVECSFRAAISDIEGFVQQYIRVNNVKPVVVVDYLQVIQAPPESRLSTKDLVDMHVRRLKQLQSDNGLVMVVISSLNRQNYMTEVDYESFKESGGIEYSADVIWGLQLHVLKGDLFNKSNNTNEKREAVRRAKADIPRQIDFLCLKNRFGVSGYECSFEYYPQYDLFKPKLSEMEQIQYEVYKRREEERRQECEKENLPEQMKFVFDV